MNLTRISIVWALIVTPCVSFGQTKYPNALPFRAKGIDQGQTGSCMADAQVQALESVFAKKGRKVLLSSWHRHYKNWFTRPTEPGAELMPLTQADNDIVNGTGAFIPDYMWPSLAQAELQGTGPRPRISESSAVDTSFRKAEEMGFTHDQYSFETQDNGQPYGKAGSVTTLIAALQDDENAVTLSLHGSLLDLMDHRTGLIKNYSFKNLEDEVLKETSFKDSIFREELLVARKLQEGNLRASDATPMAAGINHRVAVVGYDANLYEGVYDNPGAFIIRNSWNNRRHVNGCRQAELESRTNPELASDLAKFRFRIYRNMNPSVSSPLNLPGYYAIPAKYVEDLISYVHPGSAKRGLSQYQVMRMDYNSFANEYQRLSANYQTMAVPYVCDFELFYEGNSIGHNKLNTTKTRIRFAHTLADSAPEKAFKAYEEESDQGEKATFSLASIPVRGGDQSILRSFLAGAFNSYYCSYHQIAEGNWSSPPRDGVVWPGADILSHPAVSNSLESLSHSPSDPFSWAEYLTSAYEAGFSN